MADGSETAVRMISSRAEQVISQTGPTAHHSFVLLVNCVDRGDVPVNSMTPMRTIAPR
jgi:hypothetical protein